MEERVDIVLTNLEPHLKQLSKISTKSPNKIKYELIKPRASKLAMIRHNA